MPILNVKISGEESQDTSFKIINLLLEKTENLLEKNRNLCAITIQYIDKKLWSVGGETLEASGKNSFYLDIKITDETNLKTQKAKYIEEIYNGFEEILGNLHIESYIYIEDVRAASYGYGGKTQEYRFHN